MYIFNIFCSALFKTRNASGESFRESQNTHFTFNNFFFFRKSCRLGDNVEKYGTAAQATVTICGMGIVCWISKARHTLMICNTCCCSTITLVASTRLIVTLFAQCPSCKRNGFTSSTENSPSYEVDSRKKKETPPPLYLKPEVSLK